MRYSEGENEQFGASCSPIRHGRGLSMGRLLLFAFSIILISSGAIAQNSLPRLVENDSDRVTFLVDFSNYTEGSVEKWLQSKGFKFEREAKDRRKLDLDIKDGALVLEAKKPVSGFLVDESANVKEFSKVRIEWGILRYPRGASYEQGVRNEALMVYIFFGYDKISSGSFLIPNSPYFISLFLCKEERLNHPYKGRYYHEGGRFVCVGKPKPNETVVSEFNLVEAFKTYFKKKEVPVISGISLGVDTASSGDDGKAGAFIESIEFIK